MEKLSIALLLLFACYQLNSQTTTDKQYFDFWEGTWYQVIDGKPDTTATRFIVQKGINEFTFIESWTMVATKDDILNASGLRSWDELNKKWMYIWISAENHFQIWEGRKSKGHWYIYKTFNIDGDIYLSRQGWIPIGSNEIMRISEKSYDDGKTWQLRFKEYYRRSDPDKS